MTNALQFSRGIEIKRADVSDKGTFTGYASTFGGAPDRAGDVIAKGAFRKSLDEHKSAGSTPGMLWAHDFAEPVGKWLSFAEDAKGLNAEGKLTLDVTRGRDAHALLKDGALSLSIGYRVRQDGYERTTRVLKDIELLEVSLVAVPANPHARITAVKADIRGPADLQRALQELGYSQREAKRIVAGGWAALSRDKQSSELSQAATLLRQRAAAITKGIQHGS
jgi:uncharacterized protein